MDVISIFSNAALQNLSATAVLVIVVVMILTGRLVPRSTHIRELTAAVDRGNEWRETARATEEVNSVIRGQNGDLIKANQAVEAFLRAAGPAQGGSS